MERPQYERCRVDQRAVEIEEDEVALEAGRAVRWYAIVLQVC